MAIYEGLRSLPKKEGRYEIILSPITVPEVISMVILAGYKPVFCDIEANTWNLDPSKADNLVSPRTAAIMTTHFYGYTNTAEPIRDICNKHGLYMVEDSAQALGAFYNKMHAGKLADFTILSFSYPKNVTTFYGGAFATDDKKLLETVKDNIKNYPDQFNESWYYKKVRECFIKDFGTSAFGFPLASTLIKFGYKNDINSIRKLVEQHLNEKLLSEIPYDYIYQFTPLQAKMLLKKLPEIDRDVERRIECASVYQEGLKNLENITIAPLRTDKTHTYLYYPVCVKDKYDLMKYMILKGCDVAIQHAANTADLNAYKDYYIDCPLARQAFKGTLMLPTYPSYGTKEATKNIEVIKHYLDAAS
jgi:dTDP-4-amino-4,6-dideoxygalactose transaminase